MSQHDLDGQPTERPWQSTDEAAVEWGPDNVEDLTDAVLHTTGKFAAYAKDMAWENDDGTKGSATKYYAYATIGGKTLPIRVNKFSLGELEKALGKNISGWDGAPVVIVKDTKGKWPYLVIKARKDAPRRGRGRKR